MPYKTRHVVGEGLILRGRGKEITAIVESIGGTKSHRTADIIVTISGNPPRNYPVHVSHDEGTTGLCDGARVKVAGPSTRSRINLSYYVHSDYHLEKIKHDKKS